jgi:hypothetical protein
MMKASRPPREEKNNDDHHGRPRRRVSRAIRLNLALLTPVPF